jgi:hypothetical protein
MLKRSGKPGDAADLVGYLPKDALFVVSGAGASDWPVREMGGLLEKAGGEGSASILQMLHVTMPFHGIMTGRWAGALNVNGMATSIVSISEVKGDADVAAALEKYDVAAMNAAAKKFGAPLTWNLDKNVAKHGEIGLHRLTFAAGGGGMPPMLGMYQLYVAVGGGHVVTVLSPTAEDDVRALLDRLAAGAREEHPHNAAVARLGRAHNLAWSLNVSALKPVGQMAGMFGAPPEVAKGAAAIPAHMMLSTAITFADGDIHWRGNWPVRAIANIVEAVMPKGAAPAAGEEEFR